MLVPLRPDPATKTIERRDGVVAGSITSLPWIGSSYHRRTLRRLEGSAGGAMSDGRFSDHVLHRTIVLPQLRLLFLPVPKAGCTSLLWLLADLAGIPRQHFTRSASTEVDPLLTVHDMHLWGPEHLLGGMAAEERARAL